MKQRHSEDETKKKKYDTHFPNCKWTSAQGVTMSCASPHPRCKMQDQLPAYSGHVTTRYVAHATVHRAGSVTRSASGCHVSLSLTCGIFCYPPVMHAIPTGHFSPFWAHLFALGNCPFFLPRVLDPPQIFFSRRYFYGLLN